MPDPWISLVTGTYNREASFQRLLLSAQRFVPQSWEMVVSDCSDVPVKADDPRVIVLPERPRLGMVKGYNLAFARARGEWVVWLNDDAELLPDTVPNAIDFMVRNHDVGLGALYYAEGEPPWRINTYLDAPYANFGIIRRELGMSLGWFDADLEMYGSDNSIAFKVLLSGRGVVGIPTAKVMHHLIIDQHKIDNQALRKRDSDTLFARYSPRIREILATVAKFDGRQSPFTLPRF